MQVGLIFVGLKGVYSLRSSPQCQNNNVDIVIKTGLLHQQYVRLH